MADQLVRRIALPSTEHSLLQIAVLGLWEDLCGPSVRCRFSVAPEPFLSVEEARSLVKIALSYHLKDSTNYNHFNICEFGDLEMSGFNCVYTAPLKKQQTTFCIVGIFPRAFYHRLKSHTSLFATFWGEKMDVLRVHHFSSDRALVSVITRVAQYLIELCELLAQIENNLRSPMAVQQLWPIDFKDTFLQRCVASHLITFGRSLVLGKSVASVNRMIHVLTLFSLPHRKELCVPLVPECSESRFHAELFVQGALMTGDGHEGYPITVWDVLKAKYPLTIVDVARREVHCSVSFVTHQKRRKMVMATAISRCLKDDTDDLFELVEEVTVGDLLTDGHVISREVEKVCAEVMDMSGCLKQVMAGANLFLRQMMVKAKVLIAFTAAWERKGDGAGFISKRALWPLLGVATEGDYLIIQALGEQLQPGLIQTLDRGTDAHL